MRLNVTFKYTACLFLAFYHAIMKSNQPNSARVVGVSSLRNI